MWKAIVAALAFIFLSGCSSMVYYPDNYKHVDDTKLKHPPEDIRQGREFTGWYFSATAPARGVIVLFHGNGQNMTSHFASLYWAVEKGYDLFVFDYPGYGIAEGKPTQENTVEAGRTAIELVHARHPQLPIIVYGSSLGGAIALRTLEEMGGRPPVCLMVLDSTFQSYKQVSHDVLAAHGLTWILQPFAYVLISDSGAPKNRLQELSSIPSLSIHSEKDPIVRFSRGQELFNALTGKKEFLALASPGHTNGFFGPEAEKTRAKFLSSIEENCAPAKSQPAPPKAH